jgi:predicted AAA+ superfamily ATPase
VDLGPLTDRKRNPERIKRLLRALARNTAMEHKIARIADETDGGQGALSRATVYEHLDLLDRVMVLENQPAWGPHLRSRAPLRTAARTHFVDASLAAAALNADEARLVRDLETFGLLFESHVLRDLRVYSQPLRATVSHYRDGNGLEVDAVVTDAGGRWGAIQIKLGQGSVDEAAASLLRLAQVVDTSVTGEPQFLAVLTAIGHGYTRPDGVVVVPIGALGP